MKRQRGFTLLELLVALAVFAVLSAMAYNGLKSVLDARDGSTRQAQRLTALQTAFLWLARDIEQAVPREVRDPYGERAKAMQSAQVQDYTLEFSHGGWNNPFPSEQRQRSYLQRVAYGLNEKKLMRKYWFDLDRDYDSANFEAVLLEGVTALEFRFVDRNLEYQTQWPPQDGTDALPQAVEVTLEVDGVGKITRLFRIAEGVAAKQKSEQR
jgi:general secretion pathway protein J